VLSQRAVPGLHLALREEADAIAASVSVDAGVHIAGPVHLCFGLAQPGGTQQVRLNVSLGDGARAVLLSHCLFPLATAAEHRMQAQISVGRQAWLTSVEGHHHGPHGGMRVWPHAAVQVAAGGRYVAAFSLIAGRVGELDIDHRVEVDEDGVAELGAKICAHGDDRITVKEATVLRGERARGLIKSRVVLDGRARAEVIGITEAHARGARGHVDCMEVVCGEAQASASPVVRVFHPEAKVTHEAAIGSVDRQALETLMARGLTPEQAVALIVSGLLR
jgi:Fe-S cluster assembly scaffold protein SufB